MSETGAVQLSEGVRAFLGNPYYAVLATINESGMPQLTAMWYTLDGDEIVMNTLAGRLKHRNMLRDPRVSLCVMDGERYVTLYGEARVIDDPVQAQEDDYQMAIRYDGPVAAEERRPMMAKQHRLVVRMKITRVHVRGVE